MILYHGTNTDFDGIDLSKSNPFKDFGKGFYLTDNKEQAIAMARKKARLFGGNPLVQEYEFLESHAKKDGLNILVAYLLGRYEEGSLTLDDLARELEFRELNKQYFFGTRDSLKYLERL